MNNKSPYYIPPEDRKLSSKNIEEAEPMLMDYLRGESETRPVIDGDAAFMAAQIFRLNHAEIERIIENSIEEGGSHFLARRVVDFEGSLILALDEARIPGQLDETNGMTPTILDPLGNSTGNSFLATSKEYSGSLGGGAPGNPLEVGGPK